MTNRHNSPEALIQTSIIKWSQEQNLYLHSVPNEGAGQNPVLTMKLVAMGMRPGTADLILWLGEGKIAYIEVKTKTGVQSEKQKKFQKRCESYGYPYRLVRSLEDFMLVVEELKPERCLNENQLKGGEN